MQRNNLRSPRPWKSHIRHQHACVGPWRGVLTFNVGLVVLPQPLDWLAPHHHCVNFAHLSLSTIPECSAPLCRLMSTNDGLRKRSRPRRSYADDESPPRGRDGPDAAASNAPSRLERRREQVRQRGRVARAGFVLLRRHPARGARSTDDTISVSHVPLGPQRESPRARAETPRPSRPVYAGRVAAAAAGKPRRAGPRRTARAARG